MSVIPWTKGFVFMSSHLSAAEVTSELAEPLKILEYPKELTLMTEYMNDVQAKRFKEKNSIQCFLTKGLNLTVLHHEPDILESPSNIIDSGIRRVSSLMVPDAA